MKTTPKTFEDLAQDGRALLLEIITLLEVETRLVITRLPGERLIVYELQMSAEAERRFCGEAGRTWRATAAVLRDIGALHGVRLEMALADAERHATWADVQLVLKPATVERVGPVYLGAAVA